MLISEFPFKSRLKAKWPRYFQMLAPLILLVIYVGCKSNAFRDYELNESTFTTDSLLTIEKRTGIKLPEGTRGLRMFYQGTQIDPSFVAKVEIPAPKCDEMRKLIEQIRSQDGKVTGALSERTNWWKPSEATVKVQRQFEVDGNYVRTLLCQEGEQWVLYLEWIKI